MLLKTIDPQILVALSTLINESFETGVFSDRLKIPKAIPVFNQKGLSNVKSNYRPISLLSICSKVFKKSMHKLLYKFNEVHDLLFNIQFGFCKIN